MSERGVHAPFKSLPFPPPLKNTERALSYYAPPPLCFARRCISVPSSPLCIAQSLGPALFIRCRPRPGGVTCTRRSSRLSLTSGLVDRRLSLAGYIDHDLLSWDAHFHIST